jgi:hypothetical protein
VRTYHVSVDLLQTLLNYLGTKPFHEVAPMIAEIQRTCTEQDKAAASDAVPFGGGGPKPTI